MTASAAGCAKAPDATPASGPASTPAVLDGTRELQHGPLGQLALRRARLGARWLAGAIRPDGSFYYKYFPGTDVYDTKDYNEVRHAAAAYSLFMAQGALKDPAILDAAEKAAEYIANQSVPVPDGKAFARQGSTDLGGQGLAMIALLERRRVTRDKSMDELIMQMASFLRSLERPDTPGSYSMSYSVGSGQRINEPVSPFSPGEALLAMVRLAQQFPAQGFLKEAVEAADYLIHRQDGDMVESRRINREDHWLALALPELYRLKRNDDYRIAAYLQADSMLENQFGPRQKYPQRIGASSVGPLISFTTTATKGEALVAVWGLAALIKDQAAERRFSNGALRNLQFQMRTQFTNDNTQLFTRPDRLIGAWGQDANRPYVRIDFVQHNILGLLGAWHLIDRGDMPIAKPLQ